MRPDKWDGRFLSLAEHVAQWSKDPRTKTGAVIVDKDRRIISLGYNGLPALVPDSPNLLEVREEKLETIIHAEINAILFAHRNLVGCILYTWPFPSCSRCASVVIQSGIRKIVAPALKVEPGHWMYESFARTDRLFADAGVEMVITNKDTG